MVPCIIMMVDRWKVPDQIASEDPPKYRVQRKDQNERESRSDHGSYLFGGVEILALPLGCSASNSSWVSIVAFVVFDHDRNTDPRPSGPRYILSTRASRNTNQSAWHRRPDTVGQAPARAHLRSRAAPGLLQALPRPVLPLASPGWPAARRQTRAAAFQALLDFHQSYVAPTSKSGADSAVTTHQKSQEGATMARRTVGGMISRTSGFGASKC